MLLSNARFNKIISRFSSVFIMEKTRFMRRFRMSYSLLPKLCILKLERQPSLRKIFNNFQNRCFQRLQVFLFLSQIFKSVQSIALICLYTYYRLQVLQLLSSHLLLSILWTIGGKDDLINFNISISFLSCLIIFYITFAIN